MILLACAATLLSGIAIVLLAWRDPKRLRNACRPIDRRGIPLPPPVRRALALLTLAPGVALAIMNVWIAFLIWLGACCTLGWAVTQGLGRASRM